MRFIWPNLEVTGKAYRVPVKTGSIVELNVIPERPISEHDLKELFRTAATRSDLAGIMTVLEGEWVSSRIVGDSHSSIIDMPLTQVVSEDLISVAAWYDNEAGFSMRLAETAAFLAARI